MMLHEQLTEQIIGAFYKVYNTLRYGFLEKVYENALALELRKTGINVVQQKPVTVRYDDVVVGEYFTDLLANDLVILEIKAAGTICPEHEAQLLNYLRATYIEVGLLLNFGKEPEVRRKIFENKFK